MSKFTYTSNVKELDLLQKNFSTENFTAHTQGAFNRVINELALEFPRAITSVYYTPQTPSRYMRVERLKRGGSFASISFSSPAVFLGQFPLEQIRFTTESNDLSVSKKFKRKATSKIISRQKGQQVTRVKVRKDGTYFIPYGHLGKQRGFFYDRKSMVSPNRLKNNIYARRQKGTWAGGKRLPLENLYGVPVALMARDETVLSKLKYEDKLQRLANLLGKYGNAI